jgi:hypothetical protein
LAIPHQPIIRSYSFENVQYRNHIASVCTTCVCFTRTTNFNSYKESDLPFWLVP